MVPPYIPEKKILIADEEIIQMNEDSVPVLEQIRKDYEVQKDPSKEGKDFNDADKEKKLEERKKSDDEDYEWEDDF